MLAGSEVIRSTAAAVDFTAPRVAGSTAAVVAVSMVAAEVTAEAGTGNQGL
jgi:hypothetical protein